MAKQFAAAGLAQTEIASKLGVPGFVVRNITTCARAYAISELEQAVKDFVDAEESVKTGRLEDKLSVELLIIKYRRSKIRKRQLPDILAVTKDNNKKDSHMTVMAVLFNHKLIIKNSIYN